MGYTHDFQQQFGVPGSSPMSPTQTLDANRNRLFVTCPISGPNLRNVGMDEDLEQAGSLPELSEIKGIVRRRRWQFLIPFFSAGFWFGERAG